MEIEGIIGDLDYEMLRRFLIFELINCNNEKEFIKLLNDLFNACGTKKQLEKKRKKLKIPPFSEKDIQKFNSIEKPTETKT